MAAHHGNDLQNDTIQLVEKLFSKFQFNAIIIEPIPNSYGVSPNRFVEEARQGKNANFIRGGESSLVAIRADEKKIPFFGGEIDHKQLFDRLKEQGFSNEDVLGFYLARQIPQWIRENENKNGIVDKKGPQFINHYCKTFEIESTQCPSILKLKSWYQEKNGKTLDSSVSTEDVAPLKNGPLFTHKISSAIGTIRDRFTLEILQDALKKYERVAVVYGGSHYMTLKKSIEDELGEAQNIMTPDTPLIRYVDSNPDQDFKRMVDNSIVDLLDFSEQENLGIRSVSSFVKEVVLYGSKASFDKMISSFPNWPEGNPVPPPLSWSW